MLGIWVEGQGAEREQNIKLMCICISLLFIFIMEIYEIVSHMENGTANCLLK